MPSHKAEVAVLGAGPAGAIVARQLGLAGVDVLLVDAVTSGVSHTIESFPASGAPLAEDIGLLDALCAASEGPAAQMVMHWRDTPETRVFEGDGPLLLPRMALHTALRSDALRHVRFLPARVRKIITGDTGAEVTTDAGTVTCQMVIDARGRHATKRPASDLVALPFTAQIDAPNHTMWLEAMPDGWLWASSLDVGMVHGALFQSARCVSGQTADQRLAYAQACLSDSPSFAHAISLTVGTPAAAGLSAVNDPVVSQRHILVGDAALARDPIASHGLVHAVRSAVQAAVAVRTILDPTGDTKAAMAFVRHKHTQAVAAARTATARAYQDQRRFHGAFWFQQPDPIETGIVLPQLGPGPVTLAHPLTRAPVLDRDCIRWTPAIDLPASGDVFTGFGPVTALDIAAACRPPAPVQEVATRLGRQHAMPHVFNVLEHLVLGGAFAQVAAAR
ncbi:MAG: NAD(P)/FAD-dependent oxidoreductase [Marivita sp.]|uniref:NAD(P)/FAD-dependent oxidoreductase n=1 Tax=Marivita sp. TaxID=2003365 RepID=UPI003EFA0562